MASKVGCVHFTEEQLNFIFEHKDLPRSELALLFNQRFNRLVSRRSLVMLCCKKGWHLGKKVNQQGVIEPCKEGKIYRKRDGNVIFLNGKLVSYGRYIYEQHYGEIPKNMFVIHRNGNAYDDSIDNLVLVSAAEIGILKGVKYRDMPDELKISCELTAKLIHLTRQRKTATGNSRLDESKEIQI